MRKNGFEGNEGNWRQVGSKAKEWWGQLTGDSMDKVRSQRAKFVGLIQEKYGYTRAKAEQEFDRHMAEL